MAVPPVAIADTTISPLKMASPRARPPPAGPQVTATLHQPGPLGIRFKGVFVEGGREVMQVTSVHPGSQAASHPQLRPGLVLAFVRDGGGPVVSMGDLTYSAALKLVKSSGRPLALTFTSFLDTLWSPRDERKHQIRMGSGEAPLLMDLK